MLLQFDVRRQLSFFVNSGPHLCDQHASFRMILKLDFLETSPVLLFIQMKGIWSKAFVTYCHDSHKIWHRLISIFFSLNKSNHITFDIIIKLYYNVIFWLCWFSLNLRRLITSNVQSNHMTVVIIVIIIIMIIQVDEVELCHDETRVRCATAALAKSRRKASDIQHLGTTATSMWLTSLFFSGPLLYHKESLETDSKDCQTANMTSHSNWNVCLKVKSNVLSSCLQQKTRLYCMEILNFENIWR